MAETDLLIIAAFIAVGVTAIGIILSNRQTRKSNELTRDQLAITKKEIEHRLKAILTLNVTEAGSYDPVSSKYTMRVLFENHGGIPASNINIHFSRKKNEEWKIRDIVSEWNDIKKTGHPVDGSIISEQQKDWIIFELKREVEGANHVAMWVTFEYGENIKDETIWTIRLNEELHHRKAVFLKSDIEKARQELKNQGLNT